MGRQHSGKDWMKLASQYEGKDTPAGGKIECVRQGKGDHVVVRAVMPTGEHSSEVIPMHRELATGTECSIKKWFMKLGLILSILMVVTSLAYFALLFSML